MLARAFHRSSGILLACLLPFATFHAASAPAEASRTLPDVENQFARLRSHADVLGFRHDQSVAPRALGSPDNTATHYQGIARAFASGRPYLFVTRAGVDDEDRGNLMVVRMGSRDSDGERLRSNRYGKGDSVEGTQPPEADRVVKNITFRNYHHPGGMQVCGDILAVPLEGVITESLADTVGKVVFYNVADPENPQRLPVTIRSSSKIGIAGLAKLPDGKFLLVTTGGDGGKLKFYRSNKESFFEDGFEFVHHDTFNVSDVQDGDWQTGSTSHQALQLLVQRTEPGSESVYLLAGRNEKDTTPYISGKDILALYKVSGWQANSTIRITEIATRHLNTKSDNGVTELGSKGSGSSYWTAANANFLAGLCSYVSPTGELLVYALEHYNWGPRYSVRFVEFRHEQVYREGNPIYEKQAAFDAPEFIMEDSSAVLDASGSKRLGSVRPWVELFDDDHYDGRSVILDWKDRNKDDFNDFRKLDGFPNGFNDRASSVRWFAPPGWGIWLYDADNYRKADHEPVLKLGGAGLQLGIRNLSDKPHEFDNDFYDGTYQETRVTSVRFIPPGFDGENIFEEISELFDEDPPAAQSADYGWNDPTGHLTYTWRLLDSNQEPVDSSVAQLTPVADSPWRAKLQTFTKGPDTLQAVLLVGPPPFRTAARTIRFLERNRAPVLSDVTIQTGPDGQASLRAEIKDEDASDAITLHIVWGDGTVEQLVRGQPGVRILTASHVYTNPDAETILHSDFRVAVRAHDSIRAFSATEESNVRFTWRANRAPSIGTDSFNRAVLSGFKTRIRTLLANDSDPDGDLFQYAGIRGSFPEGATIQEEAGWILYTPPPGGGHLPGSFEYALRDQFGAIGFGRVIIEPGDGPARPSLNLVGLRPRVEGGMTAEFQGLPGQSYEVLAASNLGGPWSPLGQVAAGANGRFQIDDPAAGPVRFYTTRALGF